MSSLRWLQQNRAWARWPWEALHVQLVDGLVATEGDWLVAWLVGCSVGWLLRQVVGWSLGWHHGVFLTCGSPDTLFSYQTHTGQAWPLGGTELATYGQIGMSALNYNIWWQKLSIVNHYSSIIIHHFKPSPSWTTTLADQQRSGWHSSVSVLDLCSRNAVQSALIDPNEAVVFLVY